MSYRLSGCLESEWREGDNVSISNTSWFGNNPLTASQEKKMSLSIAADGVATITRRWVATSTKLKLQQTAIRGAMPVLPYGFTTWGSINALCIASDINGIEGQAELYELVEVFQGYVALPFEIYSWTTSRLDRPIQMHPHFNTSGVMEEGVHFVYELTQAGNKKFTGFSDTLIGSSTLNPYRGILDFPVATGVWKRTTFTVGCPTISGKLWKADPPYVPTTPINFTGINLPDINNTALGSDHVTWIRSQEDFQNLYRGASNLWQADYSWWANPTVGWRKDIFIY